jgi:hypothetical protein
VNIWNTAREREMRIREAMAEAPKMEGKEEVTLKPRLVARHGRHFVASEGSQSCM